MIYDIVIKCRMFGISLAARWMSHNEDQMQHADAGSRGPWFPAQKFLLEKPIIDLIKANFSLTLDFFATFKNKVTD